MRIRFILTALAALTLMAFAPAPFPKRERGSKMEGVSLHAMRGTWRVVTLHSTVQGGAPRLHTVNQEIEIVADQWTFHTIGAKASRTTYGLSIDTKHTPAQINWHHGKQPVGAPYGRGILRRRGDTVDVLYSWSSDRAVNFENPPGGHWLMTLQRKR